MDNPQIEVAALAAEPAKIIAEVDAYETDLITFVSKHKGLAAQFAFLVSIPVAFLAFELGKHLRL